MNSDESAHQMKQTEDRRPTAYMWGIPATFIVPTTVVVLARFVGLWTLAFTVPVGLFVIFYPLKKIMDGEWFA